MSKKPLLILAALLAALAAGASAPAALADCVSDATVSYVGSDWGPIPMWRVSVPSMNATWDVQAADADAARAAVAPLINCPAPPPPPPAPAPDATPAPAPAPAPVVDPAAAPAPSSGPSDLAVGQATQIVTQADVTYVGNSWGPVPIWRVHVPSRNATYDVAAATADDARNAVLGVVAADIDRSPTVAPSAPVTGVSAAQAPALAASSSGAPVSVDTTIVAPAVVQVAPVKIPAKAKTAKHGLHSAPATAKKR